MIRMEVGADDAGNALTRKRPGKQRLPACLAAVERHARIDDRNAFTLGIANKFLEPYAGAVLGKIAILVLIILFIQKRPRGLFALKGRAVEA